MSHEQKVFKEEVWQYYRHNARDLPWRKPDKNGAYNPYEILVSELMLQQTQASRVVPKYHEFLARFPNVKSLAQATLGDVLLVWSGLGYNRRARYLWQAAQMLQGKWQGQVPNSVDELQQLPGVGYNTAAAVLAYAHNRPLPFIETNIRSVYIHHFFNDAIDVSDAQLMPLVTETLDRGNPREWYWALMDYGTQLKKTVGNTAKRSKHYQKQSRFEGSQRQLRGRIIRELTLGSQTYRQLESKLEDPRLEDVLSALIDEAMIVKRAGRYLLP